MARRPSPLAVSEDQVLWFRSRRLHLSGPGAADPASAARANVGIQSQQLPPSLWGLAVRTRGRPSAEALKASLFEEGRALVRTWGQRGTVHVYDAATHWSAVVQGRSRRASVDRGGDLPSPRVVAKALRLMEEQPAPVTRGDLMPGIPAAYVEAMRPRATMAGMDPRRLGASRILFELCKFGDACMADKVGAEQGYASRARWFPDHPWPQRSPDEAARELVDGYLAGYGPAAPRDVAHFLHARMPEVRASLASLDLVPVSCEGREDLLLRACDADALQERAPAGLRDWPLRLLPLWDGLLMGHADKTWTVPREEERVAVWRKAAMVSSVVLDRGRVVATWEQKRRARRLEVTVKPLARWRATRHLAGVRREARSLATHLGIEEALVDVPS